MLLPPDLRDGVPPDHLAHFIIDAVEALDLREVRVNTRGTGDAGTQGARPIQFYGSEESNHEGRHRLQSSTGKQLYQLLAPGLVRVNLAT